MNLTPDEIKKMFQHYSEVEEHVEKIALAVWRLHHPYKQGSSSHHGGPNASYESFSIEGDNVEVSLDTGCCGSYDSDWIGFPISYLYTDWQPIEEKKIAEATEKREKEKAERLAEQKAENEKAEKAQYERLKKKFG